MCSTSILISVSVDMFVNFTFISVGMFYSLSVVYFIGGGFFLTCEDLGGRFDDSFSVSAFFFFQVDISSCTLIPQFRPGSVHSGSAS